MFGNVREKIICLLIISCLVLPALCQEQQQGMPPSLVVVDEITSGTIAPDGDYIGTVYFREVSNVAAETSGKIIAVSFEEGDTVKKGADIVRLDDELLQKNLNTIVATYEQALTDLEKARVDFQRMEDLYTRKATSKQEYDDALFNLRNVEKRVMGLKAGVEKVKTEIDKTHIKAPFDGIVVKRNAELGEWVSPGTVVATIARNDEMDVIVDIPQNIVPYQRVGLTVPIRVNGFSLSGIIETIIPRGDIKTRTFPLKVRVKNSHRLMEGMEAHVLLPTGQEQSCLLMSRDAIVSQFGQQVIFTVQDTVAKMHFIEVVGYDGTVVGVRGRDLQAGMKVVIKGNERIRDEQPVQILGQSDAMPPSPAE